MSFSIHERIISPTRPPTAMPTMAPIESLLDDDDDDGGGEVSEFEDSVGPLAGFVAFDATPPPAFVVVACTGEGDAKAYPFSAQYCA
jgi:hypothetical protein